MTVLLAGCLPEVREQTETPANADADKPREYTDPTVTKDPEGFTTTESGLKYKIIREGTGEKPNESDAVLCHYKGELKDGTVFDSSYEREMPSDFPLQEVIPGWTEGLQHVSEGGRIDLIIPPELGYGSASQGEIPPNSTLYFTVELIEIL